MIKKTKTWQIGDICKSRVYISLERKPVAISSNFASFGKTYNGTRAGFIAGFKRLIFMAHIR